jgi:hypothetical protein
MDEKVKIGDVLRYDAIWGRKRSPPLWAIVHKIQGEEPWAKPLLDYPDVRHDEWALTSSSTVVRRDDDVTRCRPDPSEWPDEICVAMAKLALENSE